MVEDDGEGMLLFVGIDNTDIDEMDDDDDDDDSYSDSYPTNSADTSTDNIGRIMGGLGADCQQQQQQRKQIGTTTTMMMIVIRPI